MKRRVVAFAVMLAACGWCAAAEGFIPARQDRPPNRPYSPQEAVGRMTVPAGFHVELVASEPDIVNPIAMTFDDRGRLFVTESVEYPRAAAGPGKDCVKIIEGEDEAGRPTRVTTFVDGLNIPTGVAVGYGGVWLLNSPDLLFFREKDGKAISREVVLTGFGREDTHELPSSLTWGPDGWLYGLNGVFNAGHVVDKGGQRHDFTCAMWRLNPRTREFQVFAQGTSSPYGIAWDSEGSAIVEVCHWANDHLFHFVETGYYQRQAGAYPAFAMPIGSITDHGHQKTAYCGIAYLDTGAFPAAYRGRVCVGNIHGGCINADHLSRDGATYLAQADPDLLTANDVWFMPVSLKIGPDGCLYVLDWYDRYHCAQDASRDPRGVDRTRGRLYRLRYGNTPRVTKFNLDSESDEQLLQRLAGPNIYWRETGQRLLTERLSAQSPRQSSALRSVLEKYATDAARPRETRLHALWALIGSTWLEPHFHAALLAHPDAAFRAWAVRAAGNYAAVTPAIRESVVRLARDPAPDVQQAIWAVEKAYGQVREERNPAREKVVGEMGKYLRGNLGDPVAGQRVFKNFCAQCHTIYGDGAKIGPDITANGRSSFDQLLSNVFDPSLVIGPGYQVVTVVTKDGRNLTGLLGEDSEQRVVVKIPGGGEEVIVRNDVKYTHRSKLSMMPEGIEDLLSRRNLADLFAFLSLDKPPGDPSARPIPGAPLIDQWRRGCVAQVVRFPEREAAVEHDVSLRIERVGIGRTLRSPSESVTRRKRLIFWVGTGIIGDGIKERRTNI